MKKLSNFFWVLPILGLKGVVMASGIENKKLTHVYINGQPAAEVAQGGDFSVLETRDLQSVFQSTEGEAFQILDFIQSKIAKRSSPSQVVSVRFAQLSIVRALKCFNGENFSFIDPERSCFTMKTSQDYSRLIPQGNWNLQNYDRLTRLLKQMELYRPETLAVFSDLDNTAWAGDVADAVMEAAAKELPGKKPVISWENAPVLPNFPKKPEHKTPFDYYNYLYEQNPMVSYNYAAQAFAGLTLTQAHEAFKRGAELNLLPKAYPELVHLLNFFQDRGVMVGFVSASPIFIIIPMLERAGYQAPVSKVEGIDVYVNNPDNPGEEILLSKLIQSKGFKTWDDFLKAYGDKIKITSYGSELATARDGKSAAARVIVARHVKVGRSKNPQAEKPLTEGDMRLAAVFGDNWGPFREGLGDDVHQVGNDQGLVRAIPPISGAVVFGLVRAVQQGEAMNYQKKRKYFDNFLALQTQIENSLYPNLVFLYQFGIVSGPRTGNFDPTNVSEVLLSR